MAREQDNLPAARQTQSLPPARCRDSVSSRKCNPQFHPLVVKTSNLEHCTQRSETGKRFAQSKWQTDSYQLRHCAPHCTKQGTTRNILKEPNEV